MNSKPIGYESSKDVISFLDPNLRLALSFRHPSNWTAEKAVPLKIDKLMMDNHKIVVDRTTYECAIYQMNHCENKPPFRVSGRNELNRKWTCDVDEYGIPDYITKAGGGLPGNSGILNERLEPIDEILFGVKDLVKIPTDEGRMDRLKSILDFQKQRHQQLLRIRWKTEIDIPEKVPKLDVPDFEARRRAQKSYSDFTLVYRLSHFRLFTEEELNLLKTEEHVQSAITLMEERIDMMEKLILPFENRKNNIRPKFEIHVTKRQGNSNSFIVLERVNYNGNLHKAMNSLREIMFSKRGQPVVVSKLNITHDCKLAGPIPMPRELKMKITELDLEENVPTELMEPIIDATSSPVEKLHIHVNDDTPQNMDLEFIKTCKVLNISKNHGTMLPVILNLVNLTVNIQLSDSVFFSNDEYVSLINHWIETKKPVGTCFTFSTDKEEEEIIESFDFIADQFEEAITEYGIISIPMENSTAITVTCEGAWERNEVKMRVVTLD
uniref:FTH domain-containing protein n=1 Tax=Caenorhabditis tropicalis TaxID=1561998 RepID=A0A1I7TMV1_9PELO